MSAESTGEKSALGLQSTISTAERKRWQEFAPSTYSLDSPQSPPGRAALLKNHILLGKPFYLLRESAAIGSRDSSVVKSRGVKHNYVI